VVISGPFLLETFLGDPHCSIGDLSLLAMQGRAECEVMETVLVVVTSVMVVTCQHGNHTAGPHQQIQHGLVVPEDIFDICRQGM